MIRHFKARRDQSIAFIDKTQDELRTRLANHPALGTLDAYQWFLLLSAHTERHTNQIKEVKANPKFPKK
ncbi:MAG: DinB family protein [Bryobacteraceae bacterium]|nr:DinB family protein [Bryobacteraceae bacterium]